MATRQPDWGDMPPELLLFTMTFLGVRDVVCAASVVSRRWRDLARDASVLRRRDPASIVAHVRSSDALVSSGNGGAGPRVVEAIVRTGALAGVTYDAARLSLRRADGTTAHLVEWVPHRELWDWPIGDGSAHRTICSLALPHDAGVWDYEAFGEGGPVSTTAPGIRPWRALIREGDSFAADLRQCIDAADALAAAGRRIVDDEFARCLQGIAALGELARSWTLRVWLELMARLGALFRKVKAGNGVRRIVTRAAPDEAGMRSANLKTAHDVARYVRDEAADLFATAHDCACLARLADTLDASMERSTAALVDLGDERSARTLLEWFGYGNMRHASYIRKLDSYRAALADPPPDGAVQRECDMMSSLLRQTDEALARTEARLEARRAAGI
jgi:hypothetical protein